MTRLLLRASLLSCALLGACAGRLPPAETPPPTVARVDALPAPGDARVTLRLSFPLEGVEALLKQSIDLPQSPDFQRVTAPGQSPEVEARYAASLESLRLASRGDVLRLNAVVAYHATLRARANTPFGRIWLTKGTDWGTPQSPGRIEVQLESRLRVQPDFRLSAETRVAAVKVGAPPVKKVCGGGAFKVCVDARTLTDAVGGQLEAVVRRALQAELRSMDAQIEQQVPLRAAAESLWAGLVQGGERIGLAPRAWAVGSPKVRDQDLTLDVRVEVEPRTEAEAQQPTLPRASPKLKGEDVLPVRSQLDWQALGGELSMGLPKALEPTEWTLADIQVRGAAAEPERYWIAVAVQRGDQRRTLHASAPLRPDGTTLRLGAPTWSAPSQTWLDEAGLRGPLDDALGQRELSLSAQLSSERDRLSRVFAAASGLVPSKVVALDGVRVLGVYVTEAGLLVDAVAR